MHHQTIGCVRSDFDGVGGRDRDTGVKEDRAWKC